MKTWMQKFIQLFKKNQNKNIIDELKQFKIKNEQIINQIYTHKSYNSSQEIQNVTQNNQRLEFLGDAVIQLAVSDYLYSKFPDMAEGKLTTLRAILVNNEEQARICKQLELMDKIKLGKGERMAFDKGVLKQSIMSDILEAFFGGIYLQEGFKKTSSLIQRLINHSQQHVFDKVYIENFNPKHQIYNLIQKKIGFLIKEDIKFKTIKKEQLEHEHAYEVGLYIYGKFISTGKGRNLKEAQQDASQNALNNQNALEQLINTKSQESEPIN